MTYQEQSEQLVSEASIAAFVLMGANPQDVEFVPLKPRMADRQMLEDLKARWPGRGLHTVGVMGLCGASPRCAFKTEAQITPQQMDALAAAWGVYCCMTIVQGFAAQRESAEIAELYRIYNYADPAAPVQ